MAGRAALLGALAAAGVLLACRGGEPTSVDAPPQVRIATNEPPQVRGATYTLHAVDGAALPARFAPLDDPQGATKVVLDSGQITFDANGRVLGTWYGEAESGVDLMQTFRSGYVQDGARVLIHSRDDFAPDTATVSGKTLTVRAQFFRRPSGEHYVVVMEYTR